MTNKTEQQLNISEGVTLNDVYDYLTCVEREYPEQSIGAHEDSNSFANRLFIALGKAGVYDESMQITHVDFYELSQEEVEQNKLELSNSDKLRNPVNVKWYKVGVLATHKNTGLPFVVTKNMATLEVDKKQQGQVTPAKKAYVVPTSKEDEPLREFLRISRDFDCGGLIEQELLSNPSLSEQDLKVLKSYIMQRFFIESYINTGKMPIKVNAFPQLQQQFKMLAKALRPYNKIFVPKIVNIRVTGVSAVEQEETNKKVTQYKLSCDLQSNGRFVATITINLHPSINFGKAGNTVSIKCKRIEDKQAKKQIADFLIWGRLMRDAADSHVQTPTYSAFEMGKGR